MIYFFYFSEKHKIRTFEAEKVLGISTSNLSRSYIKKCIHWLKTVWWTWLKCYNLKNDMNGHFVFFIECSVFRIVKSIHRPTKRIEFSKVGDRNIGSRVKWFTPKIWTRTSEVQWLFKTLKTTSIYGWKNNLYSTPCRGTLPKLWHEVVFVTQPTRLSANNFFRALLHVLKTFFLRNLDWTLIYKIVVSQKAVLAPSKSYERLTLDFVKKLYSVSFENIQWFIHNTLFV